MQFKELFHKEKETPVSYGTAGYRAEHTVIRDIVRRAYLFCLIRSSITGRPVGLVLTASHNPPCDNGVKYIDCTGNMITEEDEVLSDQIVNGNIQKIEAEYKTHKNSSSTVIICRDTRNSGEEMINLCKELGKYVGDKHVLIDMGVLSTPQGHFIIRDLFSRDILNGQCTKSQLSESIRTYYKRMQSFCLIVKRIFREKDRQKRVLDSSNGVSKHKFKEFQKALSEIVDISLLKNDKELNEECGSDYIKSKRKLPAGITLEGSQNISICTEDGIINEETLVCAFDGDADRILYVKPSTNELIDGDRLCVLFACFLNHLLLISNLNSKITTVVTDYTNGAAVRELRLKGSIKVAGTGVKNMQKASNNELTVWFESNGHGTVCFSSELYKKIEKKLGYAGTQCILDLSADQLSEEIDALLSRPSETLSYKEPSRSSPYNELFRRLSVQEALLLLYSMGVLFDPYIGDALVNMLVSESVFYSGFILPDVLLGIYQEMPNILTSVQGKRDRVNELLIESIKTQYSNIRVHLRPSGTEDLIRIYVEGELSEELNKAVNEIKGMLSEL